MLNAKRFRFTERENYIIIEMVKLYGEDWDAVSKQLPGRTPKQIHDRYRNYLRQGLRNGPWTAKEDEILINMYNAIGPKWSKMMNNLPGRSGNDIKNRWHKHLYKNYIEKENQRAQLHSQNFGQESNYNNNSTFCEINQHNIISNSTVKKPMICNSSQSLPNKCFPSFFSVNDNIPEQCQKDALNLCGSRLGEISKNNFENRSSKDKPNNQSNYSQQIDLKEIKYPLQNKINEKMMSEPNNEKKLNEIFDFSSLFKTDIEFQEIAEELSSSSFDYPWI